jgi:hypothetical protein
MESPHAATRQRAQTPLAAIAARPLDLIDASPVPLVAAASAGGGKTRLLTMGSHEEATAAGWQRRRRRQRPWQPPSPGRLDKQAWRSSSVRRRHDVPRRVAARSGKGPTSPPASQLNHALLIMARASGSRMSERACRMEWGRLRQHAKGASQKARPSPADPVHILDVLSLGGATTRPVRRVVRLWRQNS